MQREKLPCELEEEILSLIPLKSLVRFKSVCKRWSVLLNDKIFVKKHLACARPQFILISESKICAVDVNLDGPSIKVHNLPSYIPGYECIKPMNIRYCDGLLVFETDKRGTGICNPWLGQIRWIKSEILRSFHFSGMGYDYTRPESHYKIFASNKNNTTMKANITELGSNAWKPYEFASDNWNIDKLTYGVSLNGTLYWVALNLDPLEYFIQSFDFSVERFKPLCILPSKHGLYKVRSLAVFKGNRFSYLENDTKNNIVIWVTKNKIKNGDGEDVKWMKLMNVAIPKLLNFDYGYDPPTYFIDDKSLSLVLCNSNSKGKACIYIAKGDKLYEIRIQELADYHPRHCTYYPGLTSVHIGENNEATSTMNAMGWIQQLRSPFTLPRGVEATNGVGENEWDDGLFNNVKQIRLGQKYAVVVFVQFNYSNDNTVVAGTAHGNSNQISTITFSNLPIADDDYIKAVEGTYIDGHITSLTFRLRKRVTHQYGLKHGTSFVLRGGKGSKIIGFYGRTSDVYLTALGVHLFQRSSLPPSTSFISLNNKNNMKNASYDSDY